MAGGSQMMLADPRQVMLADPRQVMLADPRQVMLARGVSRRFYGRWIVQQ